MESQRQDQWLQEAETILGSSLPGAHVLQFSVAGVEQQDFLRKQYAAQVPRFAERAGDLMLFRPALMTEEAGQVAMLKAFFDALSDAARSIVIVRRPQKAL
jgi:hypothetical protein